MKYFQVVIDGYDYFSKNAVIKGELLTTKERSRLVPHVSDSHFKEIEISSRKTFTNFGVRLIKSEYREI